MRKYTKLLTLALALVMMAQMSPLGVMGDAGHNGLVAGQIEHTEVLPETPAVTEPEASELPEIVEGEEVIIEPVFSNPAEEVTESTPDTPAEEEVTEPAVEVIEDPVFSIISVQWRNGGSDIPFATMSDNATVIANYIDIRIRMSAAAETATIMLDGIALDTTLEGIFAYASVEMLNGAHTISVVANGDVTAEKHFTVSGSNVYPSYSFNASESIVSGGTASVTVSAKKLKELSNMTLVFNYDPAFRVDDVIIPDGFTGEYSWYKGVLTVNISVYNAGIFKGDDLLTVVFSAPAAADISEGLTLELVAAVMTPVSNNSYVKSEYFVGSVTTAPIVIPAA